MKLLMLAAVVFATALSANGMSLDGLAKADAPRFVYLSDYNRAETHLSMGITIGITGSIGKMFHVPNVTPLLGPNQPQVVRMNRDTLYSYAVFDLTTPVTFELPPNNGFYMSLYAIDEDQFTLATVYTHNTRKTQVTYSYSTRGDSSKNPKYDDSDEKSSNKPIKVKVVSKTRYLFTVIRTLANPFNLADLTRARELQKAVTITQASLGQFIIPNWDRVSLVQLRDKLAPLTQFLPSGTSLNGKKGQIDETVHLIGTAALWGGLPAQDAVYQIYYPPATATDSTVFTITVGDVPVSSTGFWSVTVYNATGLLQFNQFGSYSFNSLTATPEADGTHVIHFSSVKTPDMKNWLYTFPGWNYMVRLYQPSAAILNNEYQFPSLVEAL